MREVVVVSGGGGSVGQVLTVGPHTMTADEPPPVGEDSGPSPHELLLSSLGACTAMTVMLYARRKEWPLERVEVRLTGEHLADAFQIRRRLEFQGPLDDEQRRRLLEIASRCPVHRTLTAAIRIESALA